MKKHLLLTAILGSMIFSVFAQFDKYQSFEQLDSLSQVYFRTNKVDSAILAVETAQIRYPENDMKASHILGFLYVRNGNDSKAIENWESGHGKGYFFGLNTNLYIKHFGDNEDFKKVAQTDQKIGEKINSDSHIEFETVLPNDYTKDRKYPLIFVFHGNGRNMEKAKQVWISEIMKKEFIVVYLQSYLHSNSYDFRWALNDEKTTEELKKIYEEIIKHNSVAKDKILLAGMSAGGMLAIDYAFNETLPASGLLLNCPVVPELKNNLNEDFVKANKRMVIISGENDFSLEGQLQLIEKIEAKKGDAKIKIIEGSGHQYPNNFSSLLDEYLTEFL